METMSVRFENRLDGASNFLSWKERVTFLLKENHLWEIVDKVVPSPIDPQELASQEKNQIRIMQEILDTVKDHLIPYLSKKKTF
jgi:hypothetical protein